MLHRIQHTHLLRGFHLPSCRIFIQISLALKKRGPMSAINFPLATTSLFVNTITTNKIIYLPAASTVGAGRLFYIKDICGNAAASSIYISTVGMDRLENRFQPSTLYALMSTNYGSILMAPDGALNWYFLQHYYKNAVSSLGSGALVPSGGTVVATGGTITTNGSYKVHSFTTVGANTFTITSPASVSVTYLVVAGGGGGGVGRGGGGGGGGVLTGTTTLSAGSYTITVGAGGANAFNDVQGGDGGSSSIGTTVVTTGGGGGGGWTTNAGRNGGSGGGASAGSTAAAGTGIAGQGYAGAARLTDLIGGGGGGAGAAASGSTGGIGISSTITGSTTYYAGGGGGGAWGGGATPGVAYGGTYEVANGTYGGGNGANTSGTHHNYQDAVANTGGGGGGQEGYGGNSGYGGSGIVIITYYNVFTPLSISGIGLQVWWDGADPAGTGTAPADGASISSWVDKSGNGYNATASVAATYSAANKSVYFNNSLYTTNYPANPTNETLLFVFVASNPSANTSAMISGNTGTRGMWVGTSGAGNGSIGMVNSGIAWLQCSATGIITAGTTYLGTGTVSSSTNTYVSVNGALTLTGPNGGASFSSGAMTALGRENGSSFGFVGYAKEIIFYNTVLSTLNRQKIEGYLAWKWGIQTSLPSGHPYYSSAPTA